MPVELSMEASRAWNMRYLLELGENRPELLLFYGHRVTKAVTETCLSQWYPCQFEVDGVTYTSAEQYMMAEKAKLFGDEEIRSEILCTSDPRKCKALGRKVRNFDKAVWNKEKEHIVRKGNTKKFLQNSALRSFLLSTGDKVLVEASPTDRVWGIGLGKNNSDALDPQKWRGQNLLGFALMNVRDFLAFMDSFGEFDEETEEYPEPAGQEKG
ncbi:NADAR family protein [Frisingicoccus sp.]|uniref:NADAR family protein n=1 Tax=Frisingicoccus sp. TaxID=1918627 RepID=UPI00399C0D8D